MKKQRLLELAGIVEGPTYAVANQEAEDLLDRLAAVLAKDAKKLAGEVFDEEGPGRSGAKSKEQYVKWAVKQFLDSEYTSSIIKHLETSYKEEISEQQLIKEGGMEDLSAIRDVLEKHAQRFHDKYAEEYEGLDVDEIMHSIRQILYPG